MTSFQNRDGVASARPRLCGGDSTTSQGSHTHHSWCRHHYSPTLIALSSLRSRTSRCLKFVIHQKKKKGIRTPSSALDPLLPLSSLNPTPYQDKPVFFSRSFLYLTTLFLITRSSTSRKFTTLFFHYPSSPTPGLHHNITSSRDANNHLRPTLDTYQTNQIRIPHQPTMISHH